MDNIINFRSLEGLKTQDNKIIKKGMLFRCASPETGDENDLETLSSYHLDVIFDFRGEEEKKDPRNLTFNQRFNRLSVPVDVANIMTKDSLENLASIGEAHIDDFYKSIYLYFVESAVPQYRQFAEALNEGKRILFHCTAGKDRTGFAAFIALSALGMNFDVIMKDYMLSQNAVETLYKFKQKEAEEAKKKGISDEFFRLLLGIKPEYLLAAKEKIEADYGDVETYLKTVLGVDIDRVRTHYLN